MTLQTEEIHLMNNDFVVKIEKAYFEDEIYCLFEWWQPFAILVICLIVAISLAVLLMNERNLWLQGDLQMETPYSLLYIDP